MNARLLVAFACYAVLAISAGFTLPGKLRVFIWIVLAALAVKTWIASRRGA
jgi:hypothetical protein